MLVVLAHRGKVIATGMMACLGIFLNKVGLEPVKYTRRFTFDQTWLASGIDLIVVVLGLFALSQAFLLLVDKDVRPESTRLEGGLFGGLNLDIQARGNGWLFLQRSDGHDSRCGEFTSQFMSCSYAQKTSKTPELFDKGSPEGLVAAESANNAVPGSAMIPLLALGIPGEALTAMMLSVFYVHSVIPGPQLFADQMLFVVALYASLLLFEYLCPDISCLFDEPDFACHTHSNPISRHDNSDIGFFGLYSLRNSMTDCIIGATFGILGLILKHLEWPIVPIILGMVLGGIMEVKLRSSMARIKSPLDFVDRPIAAIIFAAIVLVIGLHIWTYFKKSDKDGKVPG